MKKLVISILIICLIASFIIINYFILKRNIDTLELMIDELINDRKNNYKNSYQLIDNLQHYWQKNSPYVKTVIRHNEWEDIYISIVKLKTYLKTKAYDMYLTELDELKADIDHLFESEKFTIDNIF